MKTTEMIKALERCEQEYGDLDIEILIQNKDGIHQMDEQIYFERNEYEDGDKCSIQNFPY